MPVYIDGELVLYGFVGDSFWDEGFTAREVLDALAQHGRDNDLVVRLNSGGGYIDDGIAIYNALAAHKGKVRVEIDGVAASSGSAIAMAGDEIVMKAGTVMMIHEPANPFTTGRGTISDHELAVESLKAYAASMASIYAECSGNSIDEVRAAMAAETWMTADEAVAAGYATEVIAAIAQAAAAHDYRAYAHAPARLVALAKQNDWSFKAKSPAASAAPTRQKEIAMTDKTVADAPSVDPTSPADVKIVASAVSAARAEGFAEGVKAANARRAEIMALDEAKGREAQAEALIATDLAVEQIKGILAAAPLAPVETSPVPDYDRKRAAGAGLAEGRADRKSGLAMAVDREIANRR